jgi:diketogulonate reductase-like aldo/keto reductase
MSGLLPIISSALFLLQELRRVGKLPPPGSLAKPLRSSATSGFENEPFLTLNTSAQIPQLAFGLYKVPDNTEGEKIIINAIASGYRHFDSASVYGNERTLGIVLKATALDRSEFFITGKVWNDAVSEGRTAVRASVEKSLRDIGCTYFDLFLVHWPVPGHFVAAYKELELLHREGKLKAIGLSNFTPEEYEDLVRSDISIPPCVNQIEVSPLMYRKDYVDFFQERDVLVFAHKALYRGTAFDNPVVKKLALTHSVTCAQLMLKWGMQKNLILATKTSHLERMKENRSLGSFELTGEEMALLDSLTSIDEIQKRNELENERKRCS